MNYYNILNFKKEPFSNSPEPEFLFQLHQHSDCLQKLELAVRLRRGINVVLGDIGIGKTTLCRKLIQNFSSTSASTTEIETHLLLDPAFNNAVEFLQTFALMLGIRDLYHCKSEWHLKEKIKDYLFDKGMDEKRIVVLIIDEGQKIPANCLEILREFLNYETNSFKLLQIIIFAQKEFQTVLKKKANLVDRVNLLYHLKPLNFKQMREMINFRLSVARGSETVPPLFSFLGFIAVYLATGGYPRKIVLLCHQVVLRMIIRDKKKAGWFLVRSCVHETATPLFGRLGWASASFAMVVVMGISISAITLQSRNFHVQRKLPAIPATPIVPKMRQVASSDAASDSSAIRDNGNKEVKMPDYIGKMTMTGKRRIWWTLYNIYGDTGSGIMNAVLTANPHIKNKNKIMEGTIITFPSIPADIKPIKENDIIVALEGGHDLETMYNIFRNNPDDKRLPPLAFFSFWNKKEGLNILIIIDRCFNDIGLAKKAASALPPAIASKVKILSQWKTDTVFFNRRVLQQ